MTLSDAAVRAVLLEELDGRAVALDASAQAPAAALDLLQADRETWPLSHDGRDSLVLAVAVAILRLRGRGIRDADLLPALGRALAGVAQEAGLAS